MSRLAWGLALALGAGCGPGETGPPPTVLPLARGGGAPASAAQRAARAEDLLGHDRLAEASAEFRAILAEDEKNVPALVGLSRVAARLEDGPASLRYLSRAAELRPDDGSIANQLGVAQVASGHRSDASASFERAARLSPENPLVFLNAAQNRADLGDWENARRFARRAAELIPQDATPWLFLGRFEMRQEHYARAVPLLEEAARRAPENAIVRYHLGKSLAGAGRREEAREAFRIALGGHPPPEIRKEIEQLLTGK